MAGTRHGDRHEECLVDLIYLRPFKRDRLPPAKITFLTADQSFLNAPELGVAGALQCQDEFNVEKVQRGMHALRRTKSGLTMGVYQHSQARHFHNLYERYLGL